MLRGQKVELVPLRPALFESYLKMFSPTVQKALGASKKMEAAYLSAAYEKSLLGLTFFYCIIEVASNRLVGALEIRRYNTSQLYCWLNENYWGKGLLQEALPRAAYDYFMRTGEWSFTAHVAVTNVRSCRALRKCGLRHQKSCQGLM